jgi:hypothetical protein
MQYKITINSTPEHKETVTARTHAEAKRIATRNAILLGIKVLYIDEIDIEELAVATN